MKQYVFTEREYWINRHQAYKPKIDGFYKFNSYPPREDGIQGYKRVSKEFQEIIEKAVKNNWTLRAVGSSWSLSKVGDTNNRIIETKNLKKMFKLGGETIHQDYVKKKKNPKHLRFVECGWTIGKINNKLLKDGLSLKASGSNNGQTLPGVVSTNTHGSAWKFGSTQEMVVGIHLVTGPNSQVYLERESYPVLSDKFPNLIGAPLKRSDKLFNAALVSFGSFGIIRGLLIETRPLFLLHLSRKFRVVDKAMEKAITKLDFSGFKGYFKRLEKQASDRNGFPLTFTEDNLYHFQVTVSANGAEEGKRPKKAAVFFGFESPYRKDYKGPPKEEDGIGPGASGLELIGKIFGKIPGIFHGFVKKQLNAAVEGLFEYEYTGTIPQLFRDEKTQGKVFASGIGIPIENALDVLDIALRTYEETGKVMPILYTMRFVKGTQALLGFTKFKPRTCVFEIDGLNTDEMLKYANLVWERVAKANIKHTMHWGKFNWEHLTPERIEKMYEPKRTAWIEARKDLLKTQAVRKVFNNGFLNRVGLDA